MSACGLGGCASNSRIVRSVLSLTWGLSAMENLYQIDGWPDVRSQVGTVAQVHAIGQISLIYNLLQEAMEIFFKLCMPADDNFSVTLFHSLNNRNRIDLLSSIIKSNEDEEPVREALLEALLHFDICTENRNILMHALGEIANPEGIQISKKASKSPLKTPNVYRIPTKQLRQMADETEATFDYVIAVHRWLIQSRPNVARPFLGPTILDGNGEPLPLPQKPPKPHRLRTSQLPEGPKGG